MSDRISTQQARRFECSAFVELKRLTSRFRIPNLTLNILKEDFSNRTLHYLKCFSLA